MVPHGPPMAGPLRREGALLVAAKGSDLGGACIKCGEPNAPHRKHVNLSYLPPATWFALLLSLPAFVVIALLVRKKSGHWINLCDPCNQAWDKSIGQSAASGFAIVGSLVGAGVLMGLEAFGAGAAMMMAGPFMGIAGLVIAAKKRLRANRVDQVETRIAGAGERYIQQALQPPALPPAPDHYTDHR